MMLKSTLVLLCAVSLPSVLADPIEDLLRKKIAETNNETANVESENIKLEQAIVLLPKEFGARIEKLGLNKQNISAELKKDLEAIKKLNIEITNISDELQMVKDEIEKYKTGILKTDLGLKWTGQFITHLMTRREDGENKKCLRVEGFLYTGAGGGSFRRNSDELHIELHIEQLVLELQMAQAKLDNAKSKRDALTAKLKVNRETWTKIVEDLQKSIVEVFVDEFKASEQVIFLKGKLEYINKQMAEARATLEKLRHDTKEGDDRVAKLKKKLEEYSRDTSCYAKLERQVFSVGGEPW